MQWLVLLLSVRE
jgi:hypothetical protein